ncbi:MAG: GAF domain-containing protein [Cytophagaceae bacterium]|nr:GAF domain-containing protein [Cytophagaceae bacterium]
MNFNWTLSKKLTIGFIAIFVVCLLSVGACLFIITKSNSTDIKISEQTLPTVMLYKDLNTFCSELKRLNNSYIYTPNTTDKTALTNIFTNEYADLKLRAKVLYDQSNDAVFNQKLDATFASLDDLKGYSGRITKALALDEDYANDAKVDEALLVYEKKFLPKSKGTSELIQNNLVYYTDQLKTIQSKKSDDFLMVLIVVVSFISILIFFGYFGFLFIKKTILDRLISFKDIIYDLSQGRIVDVDRSYQSDEIGAMQNSIKQLINGLKDNTNFAVEIGKGNYDVKFQALGEADQLGNALLEMRSNLKKNVQEEDKRAWANTGIAKFSDMLRQNYQNLEEMSDVLLKFLVQYSNSMFGCIFFAEKNMEGRTVLVMQSCYASQQKKHLIKTVEIGEGLVGQCYVEREYIFMTEIPSNYIKITSGLGKALPSAVLIIPIKFNDEVLGIIELASFQVYKNHEVELLLQLSENFASSLSNLTMNIKTRQLLDELKQQSNVLREQEEEMRQNMEELTATQEEMERKTHELELTKQQQEELIQSLQAQLKSMQAS